jgi:hypothetical protein
MEITGGVSLYSGQHRLRRSSRNDHISVTWNSKCCAISFMISYDTQNDAIMIPDGDVGERIDITFQLAISSIRYLQYNKRVLLQKATILYPVLCVQHSDGSSNEDHWLDDRSEMFLPRHIDTPIGSRCCVGHTIDNRLSSEAFSSVQPYKVQSRPFCLKALMSILDSYCAKVMSRKHIDFDDYL